MILLKLCTARNHIAIHGFINLQPDGQRPIHGCHASPHGRENHLDRGGQCYLSLVRSLRPIAIRDFSRFRCQSNKPCGRKLRPRSTRLIRLVGLIEQKVRSQLLVLVEGEVCLDDHLTLESKTTQL